MMFGIRPFRQTQRMFADQFQPDGSEYLYRKNLRSAPVRVTDTERDQFVDTFVRKERRLAWAIMGVIVVGSGIAVAFDPTQGGRSDSIPLTAIAIIALGVFAIFWRRIWNAPAYALSARGVEGSPRSRSEAGREMIARMSWGQFAVIAVGGTVAWFSFLPGPSVWIGWRFLWAAAGMILAGAMCWRAWQKVRMGPRR